MSISPFTPKPRARRIRRQYGVLGRISTSGMRDPARPFLVANAGPAEQRWERGQAGAEDTQADLDNGPYAWFDI